MHVRQSKAKKLPAPYRLSGQALGTIIASVILTWISVVGMCATIMGAGMIVDKQHAWFHIIAGPVIVALTLIARSMIQARGQIAEENRIRHRIIDAVFAAGPARATHTRTGEVVSLATESSEKMMALRVGFIAQIIASLSAPLLVIAAIAWSVSGTIALIMLAMIPVVPAIVIGFRKVVSTVSSESQDARKALAAAYMDALQSLSTLQLLGAVGRVARTLEETGERNRVAVMKLLRGNQLILFAMDSAFSLALVTTAAGLGLYGVSNNTLSPGQAITLVGLSMLLLEPMDQVGAFFYVGMSGLGGQRGIFGFLRTRGIDAETTLSIPNTPTSTVHSDTVVEIRDLHFGYDDELFHGANLTIRAGERIGIIGRSGQGKSTLLSLLKGDLFPTSGTITVAGVGDQPDAAIPATLTPAGLKRAGMLRAASASVAQTTWLFSGTIADNLRIAAPNATEKDMWSALERAHVADEIRRLPHGLDTPLGEQGLGISGGQAQRLSLARAIISGRRIVLLDEPTSHVDLASEREILAAINDLGTDYTLIMVTHRTSSLTHMDRVIEVSDKKLKERQR
ncbi:MAG: ATP-binding cassette domain-containing protein [Corynebacterium sp.]|uniref:ABC transporter ATP-binding protein/permease n=1 Tax=Corynebacterium sp. TaxID=1720 RepID=UPI0026DCA832|nr:ATP-binding cassette domain-containing protein [Corynebacterium sp.]MDO4761807.1 ATP-binding cassette domain-containing protein [Corynebacterium sp.]